MMLRPGSIPTMPTFLSEMQVPPAGGATSRTSNLTASSDSLARAPGDHRKTGHSVRAAALIPHSQFLASAGDSSIVTEGHE